jgi:hypothetical protein
MLSAQSQAPCFGAALSEFYRIYWYPLYAYVRPPESSSGRGTGSDPRLFPAFA